MTRRGFSLAELMVALVVAGIIGVALSRLLINQSRFADQQQTTMEARSAARAGFNVVMAELRTVSRGGITTAKADTLDVRVPVAFGVACGQPSGGLQAVLLLPYDSATAYSANVRGIGWQDSAGTWRFTTPVALGFGYPTDCTGLATPISVPSGWTVLRINPNNVATKPGATLYLYSRIRYHFGPSVSVPGRRALWRTVIGAASSTAEELVAPFDTSSRFQFLTGNRLIVSSTPPAVLDSLRGIRLRLVGQSVLSPEGRTEPSSFALSSDIILVNRATF